MTHDPIDPINDPPQAEHDEQDEQDKPLEPVCRNLRAKSMFVTGQMEPDGEEDLESSNCWCNLTQHVFGPDHKEVNRWDCDSSRPCYEPVL